MSLWLITIIVSLGGNAQSPNAEPEYLGILTLPLALLPCGLFQLCFGESSERMLGNEEGFSPIGYGLFLVSSLFGVLVELHFGWKL